MPVECEIWETHVFAIVIHPRFSVSLRFVVCVFASTKKYGFCNLSHSPLVFSICSPICILCPNLFCSALPVFFFKVYAFACTTFTRLRHCEHFGSEEFDNSALLRNVNVSFWLQYSKKRAIPFATGHFHSRALYFGVVSGFIIFAADDLLLHGS